MPRDRHILISGFLYSQLRLVSELHGFDCPEAVLEAWVRERLDSMPEIAAWHRLRSEHQKAADAEWRAQYGVDKTNLRPEQAT